MKAQFTQMYLQPQVPRLIRPDSKANVISYDLAADGGVVQFYEP